MIYSAGVSGANIALSAMSLLCRVRFIVGCQSVIGDLESGLEVNRIRNIDYDIVPLLLGELLHHVAHLLGALTENLIALTIDVGLQILTFALQIALFSAALRVEIRLGLRVEFARVGLQLLL